tara:strand:- start:801 stop:1448 length:648 start_codon:yes stop_codon:yes gene_type:complete
MSRFYTQDLFDQNNHDKLGIYVEKMPDNLFSYLKDNINTKNFVPHNSSLAGNIREEYNIYNLLTPELHNYLVRLTFKPVFEGALQEYQILTSDRGFVVNSLWVNYMKKYEFNPIHYHDGLFSWVIIVKIPYEYEKELELAPGNKANQNVTSCLSFHTTHVLGGIQSCHFALKKEHEGHIIFFPSRMRHSVYPFYTSDDYRITISGNIYLDPDRKA